VALVRAVMKLRVKTIAANSSSGCKTSGLSSSVQLHGDGYVVS
jgi:hypothetical protein